jgi:hypothetical protein
MYVKAMDIILFYFYLFYSIVYLTQEHETLGVGDDLAGVESSSDVLHKCILVP